MRKLKALRQFGGAPFLPSRPHSLFNLRTLRIQPILSLLRARGTTIQWREYSVLKRGEKLAPDGAPVSAETDCPKRGDSFSYPYRELRGSEIRLLRILPGRRDEPLACVLEQVALSSEVAFHCLSYCWGKPSEGNNILLNGQKFSVGKNLFEALQHFRDLQSSEPVFEGALWIDAICINQQDIDERSAQVNRMTQVYSSAVHTIVWLGPNCSDQEDKDIGELFDEARAQGDPVWAKNQALDVASRSPRLPPRRHISHIIETFYKLCKDRPWFRRTWIVQEVVASSKDPVLYSGRHRVKLSDMVRLYSLLIRQNSPLVTTIVGRSGSQLQRLSRIRNSFTLTKNEDGSSRLTLQLGYDNPAAFLASLLIHAGGSRSTDPRDQIYGLLALIRAAGSLPSHLDANYRLGYEEIYHIYATFLLQETGNLELINCRRNELTGVPTWVPDFRHIWAPIFSTLRQSQPSNAGQVRISDDRRILQAQGRIVGRCLKFVPAGPDVLPSEEVVPEALTKRLQLVRHEILRTASTIKGVPATAVEDGFIRSGRFDRELWNHLQYRISPTRSSTEKATLTAECVAEERRIAVYVRAAFAVLSDGRIVRCYRRDSPMILPDDLVCVLQGAKSPCILRPVNGQLQYLGNCRILDGRSWLRKVDSGLFKGKDTKRFSLV